MDRKKKFLRRVGKERKSERAEEKFFSFFSL
jgi:hypothetical protein